jgi:hypothetical protein
MLKRYLFRQIIPIFSLSLGLLLYSPVYAQTSAGQFKTYNEQYGRFSIQVPKDWKVDSPLVKQDSVAVSFGPNNEDDFSVIVSAVDRHESSSQTDFEQVIREQNADTVGSLPGATLIQDTECTKYVIDGNQACSMMYTTTKDQYTTKELDVDFQTGKQQFGISFSGSDFDKYMPIANQILSSMKAS